MLFKVLNSNLIDNSVFFLIFFLSVLLVNIFQICLYHISCQIYWHLFVFNIISFYFNICRISTVSSSFLLPILKIHILGGAFCLGIIFNHLFK